MSFKLAAVERVAAGGERIVAVATELGIHRSTLGRWKRRFGAQCSSAAQAAHAEPLDPLAPLVARRSTTERDETSSGGARRLDETLHAALRGESDPVDWSRLLDEGLALRRRRLLRLSDEAATLERVPGELERELLRDADEGRRLIRQAQHAIDRMIHCGKMGTAKRRRSRRGRPACS